jgi:hypothetical protein
MRALKNPRLDTDKFASTFDFVVAYDTGADIVQIYGGVTPPDVRGLILSAFFTRATPDLEDLAGCIGGSDVDVGEQLLAESRRTFSVRSHSCLIPTAAIPPRPLPWPSWPGNAVKAWP